MEKLRVIAVVTLLLTVLCIIAGAIAGANGHQKLALGFILGGLLLDLALWFTGAWIMDHYCPVCLKRR